MKVFALLFCVAVASATVSDEFHAFKLQHGKAYRNEAEVRNLSDIIFCYRICDVNHTNFLVILIRIFDILQHAHRMRAFSDNLDKIAKHNKEAAEGKHTYTLGVNKFADLTEEEWRESLTLNVVKEGKPKHFMKSNVVAIPDAVDWRDEVR